MVSGSGSARPPAVVWSPGRTGRRDLLLIAGGTGLAPLRAIVEQVIEAGNDGRQVTLVVGARTIEELYDAVTLDKWQRRTSG